MKTTKIFPEFPFSGRVPLVPPILEYLAALRGAVAPRRSSKADRWKAQGKLSVPGFFFMRGCPYRCTFCSVRRFFGDTIRYRPIADVVAEVEACAGNVWFNGDDNIWGGDAERSIRLFSGEFRSLWRRFIVASELTIIEF